MTQNGRRYRDAKEARTDRLVEPHALLILPPPSCLVTWDPALDGFQHFPVNGTRVPEVCESTRHSMNTVARVEIYHADCCILGIRMLVRAS